MSRTRLVVAGAGAFGREHLLRLSVMPEVEIAGIADIREDVARAAAERFAVPRYDTSAAALINRQCPEGVIVATPASSHLRLAAVALERGIPVLVEKPVTTTAGDAERLGRIAADSPAFVLPGHVLRFSTPHRRLVEIVRAGDIGRVLAIGSRRFRDTSHAARYRDTDPVLATSTTSTWRSGSPARTRPGCTRPARPPTTTGAR